MDNDLRAIPRRGYIEVGDFIIEVTLDEIHEQYMWNDAGLDYQIRDEGVYCSSEWLTIDGKSLNGLEIKERI
jgi:hypothetical protein